MISNFENWNLNESSMQIDRAIDGIQVQYFDPKETIVPGLVHITSLVKNKLTNINSDYDIF